MTATIQVRATAYYPFNGNANDESTSGKNGVVTGATLTTDRFGVANKAYLFANATTYISPPNTVTNGLTNFSIFIWVTSTATGTVDDYVFSNARAAQFNEFGLGFHTNGTGMRILRGATFSDITCPKVNDGNWHHVGVVRSGTTWSHYFDGVKLKDTTIDDTALIVDANGFVLGQEQDSVGGGFTNAQAWIGKIDEVIILPVALTANEVASLYETTSRHDWNDILVDGKFGKAADFGATNNYGPYIDIGSLDIKGQQSHSFSAWVYLNSTWEASGQIVGGRRGDATSFGVTPAKLLECREDDYGINSISTIPLEKWTHVVYTYSWGGANPSTGTMSCYINGVLDNSVTETHTGDTWTTLISWIGYESRFHYHFNGKIAEVMVFTKALSSSEVTILFNASGKV